LQVLCGV